MTYYTVPTENCNDFAVISGILLYDNKWCCCWKTTFWHNLYYKLQQTCLLQIDYRSLSSWGGCLIADFIFQVTVESSAFLCDLWSLGLFGKCTVSNITWDGHTQAKGLHQLRGITKLINYIPKFLTFENSTKRTTVLSCKSPNVPVLYKMKERMGAGVYGVFLGIKKSYKLIRCDLTVISDRTFLAQVLSA